MRDTTRGTFNNQPYVTAAVPMRILTVTANTTATGSLTYDYAAAGFTSVYGVNAQAVRNTVDPALACFATVRSFTTSQVVVQVWESKTNAVLILGVNIESIEPTAAVTTVFLTVFGI